MDFIRARTPSYLILAGLLIGLGHAQVPSSLSPATSSGNSASTPAKGASAGTERVILKVGNVQVTQAEFESRVRDIEPQGDPDKGPSDKGRRKLGDDYASVLMLSQHAVASHLDSSPEVSRQLEVARMQVLSDAAFAGLMRQANPTTEEISKYYSDHLSDYDQVHVRRLFIWKRRDNPKDAPVLSSEAAKIQADQIRQTYASGTDVRKLSADLSKSGEGMLDPDPLTFSRGQLGPPMEQVAFALKEGEWSAVEDAPAGFLVIQLVKRDRKQLGEVSSRIEKDLQGDKMQTLLDDLKRKSGIWLDEQYFGTAVDPVSGARRGISDPPSQFQKSEKRGTQQ